VPHTSRIRTPFKQHLHRFRLSILPALAFVTCTVVTLWLWNRQGGMGSVVGEVEASVVDVTAGIDGQLVAMPEGSYWQQFDHVAKGQVIAYLDDKLVQARMRTVQAEVAKLTAELEGVRTSFDLDTLNITQQHQQEVVRLTWEVERRRLDALQLAATIKATQTELSGLEASLEILEKGRGFVGEVDLPDRRRQRDLLRTRLDEDKKLFAEQKIQYEAAQKQLAQYPELQLAEVATVLAPISAAIKVQEALMQEIQVELDKLMITAPIDGVISMVYRYPGQSIQAGDPIVSIARPDSSYVISYVRQQQRISLYEGMEVGLRLRASPGAPEYTSSVEVVGPQVAQVPAHQLSDQTVPEWATPIKIPIPPELRQEDLRPGQLVHVIFRSPRRTQ
jgi:multidrug resistance efflux pump